MLYRPIGIGHPAERLPVSNVAEPDFAMAMEIEENAQRCVVEVGGLSGDGRLMARQR